MTTYTHHVAKSLFDTHAMLTISCDGKPIFDFPAHLIPESTHSAFCYKIAQLHEMAQRQAREELQQQLRNLLGALGGSDIAHTYGG